MVPGGVVITGQLANSTTGIATSSGDNSKSAWGDGDDLQIYHNGSQSYIHNTGILNLRSSSSIELLKNGGDEPMAKFIPDGAVRLYYDNSQKFETTSSGITVTGSVTTNDINMSNLNAPTPNEVDGTRGNWTMQEGADDLFLINRSNGKKYKFNLTEVS